MSVALGLPLLPVLLGLAVALPGALATQGKRFQLTAPPPHPPSCPCPCRSLLGRLLSGRRVVETLSFTSTQSLSPNSQPRTWVTAGVRGPVALRFLS